MVEPNSLRLPALGRNVRVGDFYNYFTDDIFSSDEEVPDQGKKISPTKQTTFSFFYQQPLKSKSQILGINSHWQRYIDEGLPVSSQPWFVHYLKISPRGGDDEEAQVTAIFRVERRTEAINCNFMRSRIAEYMLKSGGLATHLVGEVVYGAEVICSFHRPLDLQGETKDSAQRNLYLSSKNYFDQTIGGQSASVSIPVEFEKVSCTIFSSIEGGKQIEKSFQEFNQYLQKICNSVEDDHPSKWKSINLLLFYIPEQVKTRIELDRKTDFKSEVEQHESTWTWIEEEIRSISDLSSIHRFPLLEKVMSHFQNVLSNFRKQIDKTIQEEYKKCQTEDALKKMRDISNFLNDVIVWLAYRRHEIEEFSRLTSGTELVAMDLEDIKNQMAKKDKKSFKVFVLKVDCKEDPIINYMQKEIGDQTSAAELPVVQIFSYENESKLMRSKFAEFVKEAQLSDIHGDTSYYIELSRVSPTIGNGTIRTYDNLRQSQKITNDSSSSPSCVIAIESNQNRQDRVENAGLPYSSESEEQLQSSQDEYFTTSSGPLPDTSITVEDESPDVTQLSPNAETKSSLQQMPISTTNIEPIDLKATSSELDEEITLLVKTMEQVSIKDKKSLGRPSVAENLAKNANNSTRPERKSASRECQDDDEHVVAACLTEPCQKQTASQHDDKNNAIIDTTNDCVDDEKQQSKSGSRDLPAHEMPVLGEDRRIAEIFVDEKLRYSKLIKRGPPNIYLLNAMEKSNGNDFKWFDICRPGKALQSPDPKEHKIIILMGATGSGKSTLINGMINYILGVQWKDPFRFKCVREEENARSQAHSQTSSVTAYTLRHQKGMAIPYSITIIDTPGYGDTGGVKKDKEITAKIHRFLTQRETRIDEIHAACFVAASGDSRLTATQRYIIESVLSIFGKDMKDNLRLLVTFADNEDPPVVEACKLANFPATSTSDGISYSKFNSAVLYCSNVIQENELSFDELFWDMGQENFDKFFTMLAEMDGRNLTSTREVIQRRQELTQSLKDIENELETFLVKIEEIENYRQQLEKYGHNMKTNKHFAVESTEMFPVQVECDSGLMAYNCMNCKKTCEMPSRPTSSKKRFCEDDSCRCAVSDHEFQPFTWTLVPAIVRRTRNEMEAQFESYANRKLTTEELMANCSHDLNIAKAKVLSLLEHMGDNARSLDSTALRSNALNPAEYLSLMRSRILEEQAPGYEIRLQTLTDLQQSLNASANSSADKVQSRNCNVTTQPEVKNDNASRSRAEQTLATGTAGESKSKSKYPGKSVRDRTPSRSSQTSHTNTSGGQITARTNPRCEIGGQTHRYVNGANYSGLASTTSYNTQTYGRSRGRGRGYPTNQTETAASIIPGTNDQWKYPPGSPKECYDTSVKTSKKQTSRNDFDSPYLDAPCDSATGPPSSVQGKSNRSNEPEVISSSNHLGDEKSTYSSDDEKKKTEKKSEGFFALACSKLSSLLPPKKTRNSFV
ncbi:hypothetical protein GHT06_005413 [Daphnia sinensis]|uniref:AIG1-type G domain-containing protein n=1 Tax=Daphnia sinensis TaxID=1820382 RepID=A0AAD5PLJ4_9CRUS|nr:hypothetical protein GHT06_005413 [Daphnia sinensis]